jgi:hypothetical protein
MKIKYKLLYSILIIFLLSNCHPNPNLDKENNIELDNDKALKSDTIESFYWPITGPIIGTYGYHNDLECCEDSFHDGIDIGSTLGTPVRTSMSGRVESVGYDNIYGNFVIIRHDGGYKTLYALLESYESRSGAYVDSGTIIGYVGKTGRTLIPKLHFTIYKNGMSHNPANYLSGYDDILDGIIKNNILTNTKWISENGSILEFGQTSYSLKKMNTYSSGSYEIFGDTVIFSENSYKLGEEQIKGALIRNNLTAFNERFSRFE